VDNGGLDGLLACLLAYLRHDGMGSGRRRRRSTCCDCGGTRGEGGLHALRPCGFEALRPGRTEETR